MNPYVLIGLELLTSVTASLIVLVALFRPLLDVLRKICPDEQTANFWLAYTKVMLLLAPLLLVLGTDLLTRSGDPISSLRLSILAALGGVLFGLYLMGKQLGRFVAAPKEVGSAK